MMISRKYIGVIQVSFKTDKHNECFTRRTVYIYNIALNYFYNKKLLRKTGREYQNTHFMFINFLKTVTFMK